MAGTILRFAVTVAAIPLCGTYLPGVHVINMTYALFLGAILGLIYVLIRPLARLILSVFNFCTLGLLYVVVDAWLVWTTAGLLPNSIALDNFWWAVAVATAINAVRLLIDTLTGKRK